MPDAVSDATMQLPSAPSTTAPGLDQQRTTAVGRRRDRAPRVSSIAPRTAAASATAVPPIAGDRGRGHG